MCLREKKLNLMTQTKPVAPHLCSYIPVCCVSSQTVVIKHNWGTDLLNIYLTETLGGEKIKWEVEFFRIMVELKVFKAKDLSANTIFL